MSTDDGDEATVAESAAAAAATPDHTEAGPAGRPPLELERTDRWGPLGLHPMQLIALLVTDAEFQCWSREDARRALAWRESGVVLLPSVSVLASVLETIGVQLEGDQRGSRFPAIWNICVPLIHDVVSGWSTRLLDEVLRDVATIERELEGLSVGHAAVVAFGEEGFPEVYGREATCFEEKHGREERGRNLRTWFAEPIDAIKAVCLHGKATGNAVALVREGIPVHFLWEAPAD